VIYIVKENRTYDQVLGDLPQGMGIPSIASSVAMSTPNQHALAERFVLLDTFTIAAKCRATGGSGRRRPWPMNM